MDPKSSHGPDRVDYQETPGDLAEVHAAIERENPEPTAAVTPIPMWLTVTCGVAVCWAGLYLGFFNGGLRGDVFNELSTNASLLFPAPTKAGPTVIVEGPKMFEQGKAVYATCIPCHQPSGTGLAGQFPPLAKSPYVNGSEKRLAAILLKGLKGPVTVNGATINSQMPPWEGALNNHKLAAVATYIRSSFGNSAPPITEAQFAAARKEFVDHKDQMTEPEILQIPEDATLPGGEAPGGAATPPAAGAPATPASGTPAVAPASPPTPGAPATPAAPAAVAPAPGVPAPAASTAAATPEQLTAGKTVYMTLCIACHQVTGAGLFPVFPPLTKSPYVNGTPERFIAMVLKGNIGPMTIDGKPFNNVMPPQESVLDDTKVADVTTFVRANFGNSAGPVTKEQVAATRAKFTDRKTSWTQPELDAWKE